VDIYETEEQQLDALKKWWQDNGKAALYGLMAGLIIIFGWNYWRGHSQNQNAEASALYDQLLKADGEQQNDAAEKLAERLQKNYSSTIYADLSGLVAAKVKVRKNDLPSAQAVLEQVAAHANPEITNLANIRRVRIMMAQKQFEPALELINAIDPAETGEFSSLYDELVGDLYVALDRLEQARSSYQKAQNGGSKSPLLQFKLDDLAAPG
jgi:predicted negative regulator of RcsB-dependent stress response